MRYAMVMALGLGLGVGLAHAQEKGATRGGGAGSELKDLRQKASYGIGLGIGRNMKSQAVDLDADVLARGIKDGLSGGQTLLSDEQIGEALQAFQQQVLAKQAETSKVLGEKNQKEGAAFLAANQKKEGVKTLPSGLQYKVIKSGTGKTPKDTDVVTTHYRGTLIDGTEFDSSYKRGEPASFPVNAVIAGWTEALKRMKVGDKWQLVVPSGLAYGEKPRPGGPIGPNATLIFDVELLDVQPAPAGGPGGPR
jgi:FKBP-type peptidyl-prolyl cis-trans isomerase FklB